MSETITTNPRLGFTSASSAEADLLCPGRHLAQRGLEGYESRDATSGQIVHACFAGTLDPATLSTSQQKTVERGREIEAVVAEQWFKQVGHKLAPRDGIEAEQVMKRAHRELRLWAYKNGQRVHSGAVDALWLAGDMKFALIEDLKSLFGDVEDAASNQQLRDYAALVHLNYGCEEVAVFVNQPNVRWRMEDQKLVIYKMDDLKLAVEQLQRRVHNSNLLNAPRTPGLKQCKYCLACATDRCPESLKAIRDFGSADRATWMFWEPKKRGEVVLDAKLVSEICEAVFDVAKYELKKDPQWAEGWEVTQDVTVRHVENVPAIYAAILEVFGAGGASELASICKVSVGDLEKLHAKLSEMTTAADRKAEFNVLFGDLIKKTVRGGSLKRLK